MRNQSIHFSSLVDYWHRERCWTGWKSDWEEVKGNSADDEDIFFQQKDAQPLACVLASLSTLHACIGSFDFVLNFIHEIHGFRAVLRPKLWTVWEVLVECFTARFNLYKPKQYGKEKRLKQLTNRNKTFSVLHHFMVPRCWFPTVYYQPGFDLPNLEMGDASFLDLASHYCTHASLHIHHSLQQRVNSFPRRNVRLHIIKK